MGAWAGTCRTRAAGPVDSGLRRGGVIPGARELLQALAQAAQKVLPLTVQMGLHTLKRRTTHSLHPSAPSLLLLILPPHPQSQAGQLAEGTLGFACRVTNHTKHFMHDTLPCLTSVSSLRMLELYTA